MTDDTKLELTFERGNTFKGTAALTSSRTCAGSTCMGMQPSCSATTPISGTRLEVKYERAP